jgi:hypothetical protein
VSDPVFPCAGCSTVRNGSTGPKPSIGRARFGRGGFGNMKSAIKRISTGISIMSIGIRSSMATWPASSSGRTRHFTSMSRKAYTRRIGAGAELTNGVLASSRKSRSPSGWEERSGGHEYMPTLPGYAGSKYAHIRTNIDQVITFPDQGTHLSKSEFLSTACPTSRFTTNVKLSSIPNKVPKGTMRRYKSGISSGCLENISQ